MRKRFSLGTGHGPYLSFQECENAMRAERINAMLDEGTRVFGDDGPDAEGKWHEIDEALTPYENGIGVRTKTGAIVRIYSMDGTPDAARKHGFE